LWRPAVERREELQVERKEELAVTMLVGPEAQEDFHLHRPRQSFRDLKEFAS